MGKTVNDALAYRAAHAAGSAPHDYLSTACFHGLHERCRQQCKFCDVKCNCLCHTHFESAPVSAAQLAEQRIAELEAKLAALDWQPITESNLPSTEDEVGGWVEGKWRSQNILTAIEEFGTAHIDWSKTLVTHRRPLNPPAQP